MLIRNILLFFLLTNALSSEAQLLSVGQDAEMTILAGTDFSVDQLVMVPSRNYSIRNNNLSLTKTNMFKEGKSVSRTYVFDNSPLPYSGKLLVGTQDKSEVDFQIQLFDNIKWGALDTKPSLYNFLMLEGNAVSGKIAQAITLGNQNGKGDFEILVNPVVSKRLIVMVYQPGELQVMTNDGKVIVSRKMSQGLHELDLGEYAHSVYFLTSRVTTRKFVL
jgi:hypothetical protein